VANRNKGGRARSRKRRPAQAGARKGAVAPEAAGAAPPTADAQEEAQGHRREPPQRGRRGRSRARTSPPRPGSVLTDRLAVGERPRAPWHPLPLSELLILIGALGTVVGLLRGESGLPVLIAGLVAVMIGTVEVTLREHLSGYRSQTLILTLLPAIALYTGIVLIARPPAAVNLLLLVVVAGLAVLLFKRLRARFLAARRERTFAAKR
jgi:hypothetical protein